MYQLGQKGIAQLVLLLILGIGLVAGVSLITRSEPFKLFPHAQEISEQQNSGPFIWANPNPVPAGSGLGTTTITWGGLNDSGKVYVQKDTLNAPFNLILFASGSQGSAEAPWIQAGHTYNFSLRECNINLLNLCFGLNLAFVTVTKTTANQYIQASPNPVTINSGNTGTTRITWNGATANGEVDVYVDGGVGSTFASGASGSTDAPWIQAHHTYEFILYSDPPLSNHRRTVAPLGSVTVVATSNPQPIITPTPISTPIPTPIPNNCITSCGKNNGQNCTNQNKADTECADYYNDDSSCSFTNAGPRGDGCIP